MGRRTSKKDEKIRKLLTNTQRLVESFDRLDIEIRGYCAICWDPLTRDFPDDFPEEFRFCCLCKYIATQLAHGYSAEEYSTGDDRSFKILERITLVEGNDR